MKKLILMTILMGSTAFANVIELEPGASIKVSATETTSVSCKGEQEKGSKCKLIVSNDSSLMAITYEGTRVTPWKEVLLGYSDIEGSRDEVLKLLKEMRSSGKCD